MSTGLLEKSLTTPTQTNDRPSDGDVSASQLDCKSIALHCILVPKEFCVNDYSEHRVEPIFFFFHDLFLFGFSFSNAFS